MFAQRPIFWQFVGSRLLDPDKLPTAKPVGSYRFVTAGAVSISGAA